MTYKEIAQHTLSGIAQPLLMIADKRLGQVFKKMACVIASEDFVRPVPLELDPMVYQMILRIDDSLDSEPSARAAFYTFCARRYGRITALEDEDAGWIARSIMSWIMDQKEMQRNSRLPQAPFIEQHIAGLKKFLSKEIPEEMVSEYEAARKSIELVVEAVDMNADEAHYLTSALYVYFATAETGMVFLPFADLRQAGMFLAGGALMAGNLEPEDIVSSLDQLEQKAYDLCESGVMTILEYGVPRSESMDAEDDVSATNVNVKAAPAAQENSRFRPVMEDFEV